MILKKLLEKKIGPVNVEFKADIPGGGKTYSSDFWKHLKEPPLDKKEPKPAEDKGKSPFRPKKPRKTRDK